MKNICRHFSYVPDRYEYYRYTALFRTKCGHLSSLGHFARMSDTRRRRVRHVTYHRSIQCAESGPQPAFPRGPASEELHARHGVGTKKGYPFLKRRGGKWTAGSHSEPNIQLRDQLIEPHYTAPISAPRPLPHSMHMRAGGVAVSRRPAVLIPRCGGCGGIDWHSPTSYRYCTSTYVYVFFYFLRNAIQHAERAVSMISMISAYEGRDPSAVPHSSNAPTSRKYPCCYSGDYR